MTQDEHDAAKTLTDLSHETVFLPPPIKKQMKTNMASRMIAREKAQPPVGSMMPPATSAGVAYGASSSRKRPAQRWDSSSGNSNNLNTSNSDSSSLSPDSSDRGAVGSGSSEEDGENGNDRCFFDEQQDQVCEGLSSADRTNLL